MRKLRWLLTILIFLVAFAFLYPRKPRVIHDSLDGFQPYITHDSTKYFGPDSILSSRSGPIPVAPPAAISERRLTLEHITRDRIEAVMQAIAKQPGWTKLDAGGTPYRAAINNEKVSMTVWDAGNGVFKAIESTEMSKSDVLRLRAEKLGVDPFVHPAR